MSKQNEERIMVYGLLAMGLVFSLYVYRVTARDTPALARMGTAAVEQRITDDHIAKVQATAADALALCGYARSESAMADAKTGWLRERLEILYRRQGKMPTRLSRWPGGDVPAMEGIR